jgi:hydroxymethylpyrimidine/phosphomethylpyrimidine kinase
MSNEKTTPPVCMTIAGLDPSGGAGIIADIKTFFAYGCFPTAAVASITFQNTTGVFGTQSQSAETVRQQVQPVIDDIGLSAMKTGMLPTGEVIVETARLIESNRITNVVVDPVVRSTSGFDLIDDSALRSSIEHLFPLASVLTPNIPEAERISGVAIETVDDVISAAEVIMGFGVKCLLIKGGHLSFLGTSNQTAVDHLFIKGEHVTFEDPYIETTATHGTGCTLAAAIAANLALGKDLKEAVGHAKTFVNRAIATAPNLGRGNSPINVQPILR